MTASPRININVEYYLSMFGFSLLFVCMAIPIYDVFGRCRRVGIHSQHLNDSIITMFSFCIDLVTCLKHCALKWGYSYYSSDKTRHLGLNMSEFFLN